jgi:hypothetical protein
VYDHPFDREKGYGIIRKDNVEILIYRLENLNELEQVIGDFVGLDDFKLEPANMAEQKLYDSFYKEFVKNVKLPKSYVDVYYKDNPRMDHFYSKEDKQRFLARWNKNIERGCPQSHEMT